MNVIDFEINHRNDYILTHMEIKNNKILLF